MGSRQIVTILLVFVLIHLPPSFCMANTVKPVHKSKVLDATDQILLGEKPAKANHGCRPQQKAPEGFVIESCLGPACNVIAVRREKGVIVRELAKSTSRSARRPRTDEYRILLDQGNEAGRNLYQARALDMDPRLGVQKETELSRLVAKTCVEPILDFTSTGQKVPSRVESRTIRPPREECIVKSRKIRRQHAA